MVPFGNLFSAFSFFKIDNFNVNVPFVLILLYLFVSLFEMFKKDKSISKLNIAIFLLFLFVLIVPFMYNNASFTSLLLYSFFAIFYVILFSNSTPKINTKYIRCFIFIASIINILGIIQFFSQFTTIGYVDMTFGKFASTGYNTTASIYSSHGLIYRAHSIYLEPSVLSQNSAIVIILLFYLLLKNKISKGFFLVLFIGNIFALLSAISGTGIIILIIVLTLLLFKMKYKNKIFILSLYVISLLFVILITRSNELLYEFFWDRLFEVNSEGTSGNIRFIVPYRCLINSFGISPLGVGAGNSSKIINLIYPNYQYELVDFNSSIAKIGVECGIIGFFLYILFILLIFKRTIDKKSILGLIFFMIFILKDLMDGILLTEGYIFISMVLIFTSYDDELSLKI